MTGLRLAYMLPVIMSSHIMTTVLPFSYARPPYVTAVKTGEVGGLGRFLKQHREDLEGGPRATKQEDIAELLEFNQSYISRLERGRLDDTIRTKWKPDRVWTLLKAYKFTDEEALEIAQRFGLDVPPPPTPNAIQRLEVSPDFQYFPVFHGVAAGDSDPKPISGESAAIPQRHLKGVNPDNVRVFLVNGDCMVSQSVKNSSKSIGPGDFVGVDTGRLACDGCIVVAFDAKEDKLIVKHYREEGEDDHIILYPAKAGHPPVVRPKDDPQLRIIGVVFWRGGGI